MPYVDWYSFWLGAAFVPVLAGILELLAVPRYARHLRIRALARRLGGTDDRQ
jgi:hypothetical protein